MSSEAESDEASDKLSKELYKSYNLPNQYFLGPQEKVFKWARRGKGEGAYASLSILEPVITVERHGDEYHVAARFNIETTILGYGSKSKRLEDKVMRQIPDVPMLSSVVLTLFS
jgi:hypothetical protein